MSKPPQFMTKGGHVAHGYDRVHRHALQGGTQTPATSLSCMLPSPLLSLSLSLSLTHTHTHNSSSCYQHRTAVADKAISAYALYKSAHVS
jgi:hypothetical protein